MFDSKIVLLLFTALVAGVVIMQTRNNYRENSRSDSATVGRLLSAIRQINSRLDIIESRSAMEREQSERSRRNIYDTLGMQLEARKLDNIAVTGLLDRHASLSATNNVPSAH